MEPWIQPTTAPHQPDLSDDDQKVEEGAPRVERGWMADPQASPETWNALQRESIAITSFTLFVVLGYLLMVLVVFPYLLLRSYGP